MKSRYSSFPSSPTHRRYGALTKAIILCFGGAIAGISTQSAQAAPNVTHTLSTGTSTWTAGSWTNGVPDTTTAGDIAANANSGTSYVTTLNANVTIGALLNTGSAHPWTIDASGANVFTLDGTGISDNGFSHAGVAAIRINTTGTAAFTINPNIVLATNTDIGTTSGDDEILINGNITASAAVTLNFQQNSTTTGVAHVVAGSIGVGGSTIAITNNNGGGVASSATLSGALGSNVTSITQNSSLSALNLNGVSGSFAGPISIAAGTVTIGGSGQLGASGVYGQNISNSGTLNYNSSANQTFSGIISGVGAFAKGTGTTSILTLSGPNTYTGNTSVTAGTLVLSGNNNNGAVATTTVGATGTLQLQANVGNTTADVSSALGTANGKLTLTSGSTVQLRSDSAVGFAGTSGNTIALGSTINFDVDRLTAGVGGALTFGATGITATTATINVTGNVTGTGSSLSLGAITGSSGAARILTINPTTANVTVASHSLSGAAGSGLVLSGTSSGNSVTGTIGGGANLALTKSGTSTWTLNGSNTYGGGTTVSEGTLSLTQSNALSDSAGVNVATAGTLDLNFVGTDTVGSFSIDGVAQAVGEWGSIGSGAAHETARITGTGRINATSAGSAYGTWATSKGLTGANNGATQDPENDGTNNLLEFALNGNPLASDTSILPVQSDDGTYFIFTFNRADLSIGEVALKFEYGSDLASWTSIAIPTSATGIPVNITDNGATDQVQVKVLKSSAVGGKLFGRLQAVK